MILTKVRKLFSNLKKFDESNQSDLTKPLKFEKFEQHFNDDVMFKSQRNATNSPQS